MKTKTLEVPEEMAHRLKLVARFYQQRPEEIAIKWIQAGLVCEEEEMRVIRSRLGLDKMMSTQHEQPRL